MAHRCPMCQQAGIGEMSKRWSSRGTPAECTLCGALSHVIASTSSGIGALSFLFVLLALVFGASFQSWLLGLVGLAVAIGCNVWAWRRAELWPIPRDAATAAKRVGWSTTVLVMLASLFG